MVHIGRYFFKSLSARRAWIEIMLSLLFRLVAGVALRKESVDRNIPNIGTFLNTHKVALRKESVDRNLYYQDNRKHPHGSLSARRAWIEIFGAVSCPLFFSCRSPQGERG